MLEPSGLYFTVGDADFREQKPRVLLISMGVLVDAGHVAKQISTEILNSLRSETLVQFDIDQLIDYRARRPLMSFDGERFTDVETRELALYQLHDSDGNPFLLLAGPEPDFQWERMLDAVEELIDRYGVDLVISVNGVPMGVPHTRPYGLTKHATSKSLIPDNQPIFGEMQFPGSFVNLLEYTLGQRGHDVVGISVHVPHYLSNSNIPEAALTGLRALISMTGLSIPTSSLAVATGVSRATIDAELAESDEAQMMVALLEEQYDKFMEGIGGAPPLAASLDELPTADEIGAEFEQFLRNRDDRGE